MVITKEELKELISPKADIEKISTLSSDGDNLLTRIPNDIVKELNIRKGDKIRWLVESGSNDIKIHLENGRKKEKIN